MSTAIRHIHYKPADQELSIWFGPEGRRYKYSGVPPFIYEGLRDAESRGRFFNQSIRGRFPSQLADPSERKNRRWQAIRSAS
ncbi:MAG: hypothetical protein JWP99_1349 [Devosia sp.]|nr:hypothetical protein [Devosia sp.]